MKKMYTVQTLILPQGDELPGELFCRGDCQYEDGTLRLKEGGELRFNTYFNSFSAAQWRELTEIRKLRFFLTLRGTGRVQLRRADSRGREKLIGETAFSLDRETDFEVGKAFSISKLGHTCWLTVLADGGDVSLSGGSIRTETQPLQQPKIACCFCTYKREKEIRRNVRDLLDGFRTGDSLLNGKTDIYIADNGHTLTREDFGNAEQVFLFENRNYGGSAGFTRCLIEAGLKKKGTYSHLLLMDDDALIRSFVLERTAQLLSFLKPEYQGHMIGGALLSLQQPWLQAENGAEFLNRDGVLNRDRVDLRDFHNVLINQRRLEDVNYNAWFFSCIPSGFVTETNLPMPFFIHGDDIEYGLRFQKKILTMNGICIWHPDPASNIRASMDYYNHRNYGIIEAIHWPGLTAGRYWLTETKKILRYMTEYQYESAWYAIRGCRDFLKGIDWFKQQDPERLNREVNSWKPMPKCHIENAAARLERPTGPRRYSKLEKVINLVLPTRVESGIYESKDALWFNNIRAKEYCIINPVTGDGLRFRRDSRKQKALLKELAVLRREILANYDRVAKEWQERAQEVTNLNFWTDYLGLQTEEKQP